MRKPSAPAVANDVGTGWNEQPNQGPTKSGVYQTRSDRNQIWFKYFDANYSLWYMSWAELKENPARDTARLSGPEVARHVVAWAHCSKHDAKLQAIERIRRRPDIGQSLWFRAPSKGCRCQ